MDTKPSDTFSTPDVLETAASTDNADLAVNDLPPNHGESAGGGGGGEVGVSLGPTSPERGAVDGDAVNTLNIGGAISTKGKAPLSNERGEPVTDPPQSEDDREKGNGNGYRDGETREESHGRGEDKNVINEEGVRHDRPHLQSADSAKTGDTLDFSADGQNSLAGDRVKENKSHDMSDHTPLPLGPEVIDLTISKNNDHDVTNEEGLPSANEIDDVNEAIKIGRTEVKKGANISPKGTQINSQSKEGTVIPTTNAHHISEQEPVVSNDCVASAGVSAATNEGQEENIACRFDGEDAANGIQAGTAVDKGDGRRRQVLLKDPTDVPVNDPTRQIQGEDAKGTWSPAVGNKNPVDCDRETAGTSEAVSETISHHLHRKQQLDVSNDTPISESTDSPSSGPAVDHKDIPTQRNKNFEDVGRFEDRDTAATSTSAPFDSDINIARRFNGSKGDGGTTEKREEERGESSTEEKSSVVSDEVAKNVVNVGSVSGSNSVNGPSDKATHVLTQDDVTSQSNFDEVKITSSEEELVEENNHDNGNGIHGMLSNEVGSRDDTAPGTTTLSLHNGKGNGDETNNPTNGMSGMQEKVVENHAPSLDSNENVVGSRNVVEDRLPITTDVGSTTASQFNGSSPTDHGQVKDNISTASLPGKSSIRDHVQPQTNASLTSQNASMEAEDSQSIHATPTQHDENSNRAHVSTTPSPAMQQGSGGTGGGGSQNSAIPPQNGGGNGIGGGGGHGFGSGPGGLVMQGRDREKSVFLRLSNQIQELEMNMSLFSSYLDQISTRLASLSLSLSLSLYIYISSSHICFSLPLSLI